MLMNAQSRAREMAQPIIQIGWASLIPRSDPAILRDGSRQMYRCSPRMMR
jgi:hypothetical protein